MQPRKRYVPQARRLTLVERDESLRARRAAEEMLAQRLFSVLLAVHAAEMAGRDNPRRLGEILELIHTQAAASLDDLRRLVSTG